MIFNQKISEARHIKALTHESLVEETDRQHKVLTEHLRIHAISAKLTGLLCRDLGARLGRPMDSGLGLPGHTVPSLITPGQGDMFTHRLRPLRREQPFTSQQARAGSGLNPAQVMDTEADSMGSHLPQGRGKRGQVPAQCPLLHKSWYPVPGGSI